MPRGGKLAVETPGVGLACRTEIDGRDFLLVRCCLRVELLYHLLVSLRSGFNL